MVRQGGRHVPGTVDGVHESWREEVQVQEKQVPSSGTRRANTESCPDTHTHTHTHTHVHPGPCWLRENSTCYSGHFSTGSWNPGSWHPASCLLLKLYLKTGGGLVAKMCPTLSSTMDCSLPGSSAPLSMGFSRQEYWSGLPCPPPGDLPVPGIKPTSLALQGILYH